MDFLPTIKMKRYKYVRPEEFICAMSLPASGFLVSTECMLLKSDPAAVDMSGSIDSNILVLFHLNYPSILNDKIYGSEADRRERVAHQALQFLAPQIIPAVRHIPVPKSSDILFADRMPRLKIRILNPSAVRSNSNDSVCS